MLCIKVWCHHRGEPQGPLKATTVEQPAEQLQGAEGLGGGASQQPQGESHAVQQAPQARQHHQPCE